MGRAPRQADGKLKLKVESIKLKVTWRQVLKRSCVLVLRSLDLGC